MIPRAAKLCVSRLTKGSAFILMLWMHSAGGWRPLAEHDECLITAADLIRDYREHHQLDGYPVGHAVRLAGLSVVHLA